MSENIFSTVQFLKSVDAPQKLGLSQVEVAFVGRSNVGKSSLLNALCGQQALARVSNTPGRTRTINVFTVQDGKWSVDLPGYGFASHVTRKEQNGWLRMLELYLSGRKSLKAVFVLVDASIGASKLDRGMIEWLEKIGMPCCLVANKIDKIAQPKFTEHCKALAQGLEVTPEQITWVSAKKGTGIQELQRIVSG